MYVNFICILYVKLSPRSGIKLDQYVPTITTNVRIFYSIPL